MTETHVGTAATSVPPRDRGEAVAVLADQRRIVTDTGIERPEKVRVGGIDQCVSIRGLDRDSPVVLIEGAWQDTGLAGAAAATARRGDGRRPDRGAGLASLR